MLNSLSRTTSFMAALVGATVFGWSIGSAAPKPNERTFEVGHDQVTQVVPPCHLRFQDYTTLESMADLSDEQVFGLREQALEAYREERRWALFMRYPNSKMLLPDDSPFGDMPWDKAYTKEASRLTTAAIVQVKTMEITIATNPKKRSVAEIDIVSAAKQWDEIVTARRKLSRDILEKVYSVRSTKFGSFSLDYIYTPPTPK